MPPFKKEYDIDSIKFPIINIQEVNLFEEYIMENIYENKIERKNNVYYYFFINIILFYIIIKLLLYLYYSHKY